MSSLKKAEEVILQKLEAYGDAVVSGSLKRKKKKTCGNTEITSVKVRKSFEHESNCGQATMEKKTTGDSSYSRRKKKRLKKKQRKLSEAGMIKEISETKSNIDNGHDDDDCDILFDKEEDWLDTKEVKKGPNKQLQLLSEELGLTEFKEHLESVKNLNENEKSQKGKEPEVVVFKSHKRKMKDKTQAEESRDSPKKKSQKLPAPENPEFNLEQARFEVQKFGIKGFQGNQREEAMTALLIKLGAKPPKNKFVNYKEYQEQRKQAIVEKKEKEEMDKRTGLKVKKSADRRNKRRRDKNDIGILDGQVGRWKAGVQIVKKDELKGFHKVKLKT